MTWDRAPLWQKIHRILASNGTCTAPEIARALEIEGMQDVPGANIGRIYQLLREKVAAGEVLTVERERGKAKGYTLAEGMPKIEVYVDQYHHEELHRIARRIHRTPEETARRLMLAGIRYAREVLQ